MKLFEIRNCCLVFCLTIVIFFWGFITTAKADMCEPCQGNGTYIPDNMSFEGNYPGSAHYLKKQCNDSLWIIKIENVASDSIITDPVNFFGSMMYEIITKNPMGLPPDTSLEGTKTWKIIWPTCWKYTSPAKTAMEPCPPSFCCVTTVKARKIDNCESLVVNIVSEVGDINETCPTFGSSQETCIDVCIPTKIPKSR